MGRSTEVSPEQLAEGVRKNDRRALARAITWIESSRPADRERAERLLALLAVAANPRAALRVGITGAPGVGKSTFIEALGMHWIEQGSTVAVLSVDPSSVRSGGSILGDKTRMRRLSVHERAFVRPSPTGGASGGVARATPEAVSLCEAAGYDVVIVETVGVGQTEQAVRNVVEFLVLLVIPGAGDEIQAIKRGILEVVDCVVVNKADGKLLEQAAAVRAEYAGALRLFRGNDAPEVLTASGLEGRGVEQVGALVQRTRAELIASGQFEKRRRAREEALFWQLLGTTLLDWFLERPGIEQQSAGLLARLSAGELSAPQAARILVSELNARSPR